MDVTNRDLLSLISVILLPFIRQSSSSFLREDTAEGAKLAKRIGGHLKTLQAISYISYILLYDWSSHLREQMNWTFRFRNCHGKFFCSFWCIHGNNPRAVSVRGKRWHSKTSLPVGKRYLPMGKKASVTTAITSVVLVTLQADVLAHVSFDNVMVQGIAFLRLKSQHRKCNRSKTWVTIAWVAPLVQLHAV